jgi:hypothetical protein
MSRIALLFVFSLISNLSWSGDELGRDVFIKISSSYDVIEYVLSSDLSFDKILSITDDRNKASSFMVDVLNRRGSSKEKEYLATRGGNAKRIPVGAKWANFSNDGRYVLYGFEGRAPEHRVSAVLVRLSDQKILYSLGGQNSIEVEDVVWLSEPEAVVILQSTHYYKKTPLALLATLAGHGALIYTYYVEMIKLGSEASITRIKIVEGIEDSVACLGLERWVAP